MSSFHNANVCTASGNSPQWHIASVIAAYWVVSISTVYINKRIVSDDDDITKNESAFLDAPIFISWFQCVVTVGICALAGEIGEKIRTSHSYQPITTIGSSGPKNNEGCATISNTATSIGIEAIGLTSSLSTKDDDEEEDDGGTAKGGGSAKHEHQSSVLAQIPRAEFQDSVSKKVSPLSFVFVGMITFNNLCLKLVHVSYYSVARSLTILFNVVLSKAILGIPTSTKTLLCLAVVVLGFLVGSKGEKDFHWMGAFIGFGSSCFVSLHAIYIKKILPVLDDDHWKLTFYNNLNACILFLPIILVFESGTIYAAIGHQLSNSRFWVSMMVAGILGFGTGILTVLQIKATSPLSHNISGTAKAAVQSMMAFVIWKNKASFLSILGIFTVLGGSLAYAFVKLSENVRRKRRSLPIAHSSREDLIEMTSGPQALG